MVTISQGFRPIFIESNSIDDGKMELPLYFVNHLVGI